MPRRPPSDETLEKERRTLELRRAGHTFDHIARQLDYYDEGGAYKAYKRALARTLQQPAAEIRELAVDRLDKLLTTIWDTALEGDPKAIETVLKIETRRAQLLGLDSPTRLSIDAAALGDEIGRLLDTLTTPDDDSDEPAGSDDGPGEP